MSRLALGRFKHAPSVGCYTLLSQSDVEPVRCATLSERGRERRKYRRENGVYLSQPGSVILTALLCL